MQTVALFHERYYPTGNITSVPSTFQGRRSTYLNKIHTTMAGSLFFVPDGSEIPPHVPQDKWNV